MTEPARNPHPVPLPKQPETIRKQHVHNRETGQRHRQTRPDEKRENGSRTSRQHRHTRNRLPAPARTSHARLLRQARAGHGLPGTAGTAATPSNTAPSPAPASTRPKPSSGKPCAATPHSGPNTAAPPLENPGLTPQTCDIAICAYALDGHPEPQTVLAHIHRSLVPGGTLVLCVRHPLYTATGTPDTATDSGRHNTQRSTVRYSTKANACPPKQNPSPAATGRPPPSSTASSPPGFTPDPPSEHPPYRHTPTPAKPPSPPRPPPSSSPRSAPTDTGTPPCRTTASRPHPAYPLPHHAPFTAIVNFPAGNISRYNPACTQPVIAHASRPEHDRTPRPHMPASHHRPPAGRIRLHVCDRNPVPHRTGSRIGNRHTNRLYSRPENRCSPSPSL